MHAVRACAVELRRGCNARTLAIRDVSGLLLQADRRRSGLKVIEGGGLAANGADDVPIAPAELLDERQAEASRCSNNEDGWLICHCRSPIVTIYLRTCALASSNAARRHSWQLTSASQLGGGRGC